ncbi:hypothetical protein [Mesorhizobium caraganae]|uniref:hypothetical protein n=1 Tax=Mesorhizobium caraganae TaxID=483206 RepID=UPI00333A7280
MEVSVPLHDLVVDYGQTVRTDYLDKPWPLVLSYREKLDSITTFGADTSVAFVGGRGSGRRCILERFVLENRNASFYNVGSSAFLSSQTIKQAYHLAVERVRAAIYEQDKPAFLIVDNVGGFVFEFDYPPVRPVEVTLNAIEYGLPIPVIFIGEDKEIQEMVRQDGWTQNIELIKMVAPTHESLVAGLAQWKYGLEVHPEAFEAAANAAESVRPERPWDFATMILREAARLVLNDKPFGSDPAARARSAKYVQQLRINSLVQDLAYYQEHKSPEEDDVIKEIDDTNKHLDRIEVELRDTIDPIYDAKFRLQELRAELLYIEERKSYSSSRTAEDIRRDISETAAKIPGFNEPKILRAEHVRDQASRFARSISDNY